jgi:(p)ppGpp synthase/HD superfamily hydrolase
MPELAVRPPESVRRVLKGLPHQGRALVLDAYHFADVKFAGKFRLDKRPSIVHLIDTALIMREEMQLRDCPLLAAGYIHDVIEDTPTSYDEVATRFGKEVAGLVLGETKLGREGQNKDRELINDRNWHIALTNDARIGLMKGADRRSNMRDQSVFNEAKRREHAEETRDIYAVVMDRFGVWEMKTRLEDQACRYLEPDFAEKFKLYRYSLEQTNEAVDRRVQTLASAIRKYGIQASVEHKHRTISEVYDRMQKQGRSLADLLAENPYFLHYLSIIVDEENIPMCAAALELARQMLGPYSRNKKSFHGLRREDTGYEAEHAKVLVPGGYLLVGTTHKAQDLKNRLGIISDGLAVDFKPGWHQMRMEWLERWRTYLLKRRFITEQQMRQDFARVTSRISVLTPSGLRIEVPVGSTVLEFAFLHGPEYGLHTERGAVNGQPVSLGHVLNPNDVVEVFGAEDVRPDPSWLTYTRSPEAAEAIRGYLNNLDDKKQKQMALASLEEELRQHRLKWDDLKQFDQFPEFLESLKQKHELHLSTDEDLLQAIGCGAVGPHDVVQDFLAFHDQLIARRNEEWEISGITA